jgi:cold shock CspA family protein
MSQEAPMRGRIASISPERGSGFIAPDEEGGEIYFRRDALHGADFTSLAEGVAVEFTLGHEQGTRANEGLRAVDVRLADAADPAVDHETLPAEKLGRA